MGPSTEDLTSFDAVAVERDRLEQVALTIDQQWGAFVSSRSHLAAIGEGEAVDENGQDPVRTLLVEARARLHRARIEVVVSGFLKRGKSTLINALLGVEVSSMRVTPETARPVYVQHGERRAWVAYPAPDGHGEQLDEVDSASAASFGGYRPEEAADGGRKPLRVVQQLPIDLLKTGVILKDTPGLDDANPALAAELENLTLAELDRATVTLVVLCCPPGLSGSELRILEGLDARRIEKVFIICNFWSDVWEDDEERGAVLDHVRRSISGTSVETARIFPVNAKRAWLARKNGDPEGFDRSGVAAVAAELERYLAEGVYRDVLARSTAFLVAARDELLRRVDDRLALLRDAAGLEARRAEKSEAVDRARARLDDIAAQAAQELQSVAADAVAVVIAPFDLLQAAVSNAGSSNDLNACAAQFDVRYEAALARATVIVRDRLSQAEQVAKSRLAAAFAGESSAQVSLYAASDRFEFVRISANLQHRGGPDWQDVWMGATAGALLGGALAGGTGIALLALGPVGWLAGAALGFVVGGSLFAGLSSNAGIRSADRDRLLHEIAMKRAEAERGLRGEIDASAARLAQELRNQLQDFAREELEELEAVEAVVSDPRRRSNLETAAEQVRATVAGLRIG